MVNPYYTTVEFENKIHREKKWWFPAKTIYVPCFTVSIKYDSVEISK